MSTIATSPLTGRIYQGRTNRSGDAFIGSKVDVTSDVLRAVIEKADFHGGEFEIEGSDGSAFVVSVRVRQAAADGSQAQPNKQEATAQTIAQQNGKGTA